MWRGLARTGGAILAIFVVIVWVFALFIPAHVGWVTFIEREEWARWGPYDREEVRFANGWIAIGTPTFNIFAPPGSEVRRRDRGSGTIVAPNFTLAYEFGPAVSGFDMIGREIVDEHVRIEGHDAVLRRAVLTDTHEPYFAGLFVPQAATQDGHPAAFLISGVFRSRGDRAVADQMLETLSFRPLQPYSWERQLPKVVAKPPTFDIAPDPA